MNKIKLYLIRHGRTKCNELYQYCGKSDVSLSERGRTELMQKQLKIPTCGRYYTSGAKRANETFEILFPHLSYEQRPHFWEYDFGDFEKKSYEMIKEDTIYQTWVVDNTLEIKCPNGESRREFYNRLKVGFEQLMQELVTEQITSAVLVCHGGTIGTLLHLFYDQTKSMFDYQPKCGGGYELTVTLSDSIQIEIVEEF